MADDKVIPIRPDKPTGTIKALLGTYDWEARLSHAAALARSLALALDGTVLAYQMEPSEACLGIAELLDGIGGEMENLANE
jgi:hypothetical protein